ncbi:DUF5916 domain-containing protein [Xanthomarina spongicola]|uniref:Carbohydrate binding protein with CBM9 domain n=1 Tax=Xanthomarina spongicola TaxID=570520 RepID=A0A316DT86_9FLAO|nr:DUF5916 domain-containing protein [Xanthomarina spongicola]PWK19803.1 carbohydrate binding protein with CBM9 domain [Xanthomarina spongicola]
MKHIVLLLTLCLFVSKSFSQEKKSLNIERATIAPKIDGILNDIAWENAELAENFIQYNPDVGVAEKDYQKSIVRVTYDDDAIYFGAYLYDHPDEIMKQFQSRDNFGINDFFGVIINPNNDSQNDTEFYVFPTGNQADAISSPNIGQDFGWNAVWESSVKIVEDGWIVEMKIPYSALRFSNKKEHVWGLQFRRQFRTNRSQYSWNPIDPSVGRTSLYHGELKGLKDIQPPVRLMLYPYASTVISKKGDNDIEDEYNIGLDLKYGITENFTLDATLIPDFSQVGFDNVQLNLGPFEQQFSEQRQFFTEGVDLFTKGNLFYSRRIGNAPTGNPTLKEDEIVTDYPNKVQTINAFKISGRTENGLGVGVFNAITEKTFATIKDTITNLSSKQVVEPLANYNIFVIDQQFNGNSSISLINTNVTRNGHFRDANVTAVLLDYANKNNTIGVEAAVKHSFLNLEEGNQNGFNTELEIGKISGNYQYSFEYELADEYYDINDLGINFRNNYSNFSADFSYRIFEPVGNLIGFNYNIWANYRMLYNPNTYTGKNIGGRLYFQNKNLLAYGGSINYEVGKQYDYFEARTEGRYFIYENWVNSSTWISSNYNKTFAYDINLGFGTMFEDDRDMFNFNFRLSPRVRFNDRFTLIYSIDFNNSNGGRGYIQDLNNEIIFGQRDRTTLVNSLTANYNFNVLHALSLTFRNYWSVVDYNNQLYTLENDGRLSTEDGYTLEDISDPNVNFNTWNLDFGYSWQFAPGSTVTALYRNSLFDYSNASRDTYFDSVNNLFDQPIDHNFSLRVVYFIDYNNVKNIFKKKNS